MPVRLGVPESVADAPLTRRLAWVTGARLVMLTLSLGAIALVNIARGFQVGSFTVQLVVATLAAAFALTVLYALILRTGRHLTALATAQLVGDQAAWTVLVYLTGGASSGATSFYGLTCLLGAFLTGFGGAALAGGAGAALYVILVGLLKSGRLAYPIDQSSALYDVTGEELSYYIVVNLLVIVVVILLSGNLAERLRTAGGRIVAAEERADRAERMAELGRLATGLAHEIRNPLGSISAAIQLLRTSSGLTEEDRQLCDIIQREAGRLNELVSDMMNVAKPRAPDLAPVDIAAIAREVVRLASQSGRAISDVTVICDGEPDMWVKADGAQMRQLIWNLVRNAVQASTAGDEVRVAISELAGGQVELCVRDDGVGLDDEAKERLFDAFFTTRSHGTGIGLAVVKRIADDHGFTIAVESERGRGATFRVRIGPRLQSSPETQALAAGWVPSVPPG